MNLELPTGILYWWRHSRLNPVICVELIVNKLVNILCAMLLFGPLAMGFAWDDASIKHSNKEYYTPGNDIQVTATPEDNS